MLILGFKCENILGFDNFNINFSYQKKLTNSTLDNEFLENRQSFNYKKINIIYGNNATGKTSFGKIICAIFNFIKNKEASYLKYLFNDELNSYFSIDLVSPKINVLYRLECKKNSNEQLKIRIKYIKINGEQDTYEKCIKKIDKIYKEFSDNFIEELNIIDDELTWLFIHPLTEKTENFKFDYNSNNKNQYIKIMNNVLKTLDPSILKVEAINEIDKAFVITLKDNKQIIIDESRNIQSIPYISSGTKYGIYIANLIFMIKYGYCSFYYIDEQFSYISSELESYFLTMFVNLLKPNQQLFFTTHNVEIMTKSFPKHSFWIFKKNEAIDASKIINKNNANLKNYYLNDAFNNALDTNLLDELME